MIMWTDGAIENPQPATDEAVREAEQYLGVKLPADFLAIAQTHQCASQELSEVDMPSGFGTAVECLLHVEDSPFTSNILAARFPMFPN